MKSNFPIYILSGVVIIAILVFGFYPMFVRRSCLKEARKMADSVANAESNMLQKGLNIIKTSDYTQVRDDRYSQCLAEHGL